VLKITIYNALQQRSARGYNVYFHCQNKTDPALAINLIKRLNLSADSSIDA
jgi:hypothetical protein